MNVDAPLKSYKELCNLLCLYCRISFLHHPIQLFRTLPHPYKQINIMSYLVEKGNTIYVPAEYLGGDKSQKTQVALQQMMREKKADYWVCKYTTKSGAELY